MRTVLTFLLLGALLPGMAAAQGEIMAGVRRSSLARGVDGSDRRGGRRLAQPRPEGRWVDRRVGRQRRRPVQCARAEYGLRGGGGGLEWHSLGLKADGSIVAWGNNAWPVRCARAECGLRGGGGGATGHSLGLKADGSIVAWGTTAGQCDVPAPNADFVARGGGWIVTAWA